MDLQGQEAGAETADRQHELKFGRRNGRGRARREMPVHVQEPRKEVPEGVELKEKHGSHSAEGAAMPQTSTPPPRQLAASPQRLQCTEEGKGLKGTEGGNMKV